VPALYAVFIWLWGFNSGKETVTMAVQDRYWLNEWLHEAAKEMAEMCNLGERYVKLAIV
jgi:hypothetical protein